MTTDAAARQAAVIERARRGDVDAFSRLVRDYQDMAVGYAVSLLGDFHAAEDAAQEAFVELFAKLGQLRDPQAFPAWFRRLVRSACTRRTRRARLPTVSLERVEEPVEEPVDTSAGDDTLTTEVMAAVRGLPESERSVITLFYSSRYSHREIARFLDLPETTVHARLRAGRARLQERMWKMAQDHLRRNAPSRDSRFGDRVKRLVRPEDLKSDAEMQWSGGRGTDVWEALTAAIRGDLATLEKLVASDPRLATCSHQYRTPLHFAAQENHVEVVRFLLAHGADATYRSGNYWHERPLTIAEERGYQELADLLRAHLAETAGVEGGGERIAAAIRARDVDAVARLLASEPALLSAGDARGNQAIHWAVMIRSMPMIDLVLDRGGDVNARRPDGARPLDLTNGDYFHRGGRDVPAEALKAHEVLIGYLIARGAEYDIWVASKVGDTERVRQLLAADPSLANQVPPYSTYSNGVALDNACRRGDRQTVRLLLDHGADPNTPEPGMAPHGRALHGAARSGDVEIARWLLEQGANPNAEVESSGNCMSAASDNPQMLQLLASYGGEFGDYQDLSRVSAEGVAAVYGDAPPLRYYVDKADVETLARRMEAEPALVAEVLNLALRRLDDARQGLVRLCLEREPAAARQVHANELIYGLHRLDSEDEWLDVFGWLLDAGMTPNDSDWLRVSSLHRLAIGGIPHGSDGTRFKPYTKTMALFIEAGADLDARDEEFRSTPLGWAARWGRQEAVELLLARGARPNLPDDLAWSTPLAWARTKGHDGIVRTLQEAGATA